MLGAVHYGEITSPLWLTVIALGAVAFIGLPAKELAEAVRRVHQGLRVIDPELVAEAWGEADPLTGRERQVVRLAGRGWRASRSPRSWGFRRARCEIICLWR